MFQSKLRVASHYQLSQNTEPNTTMPIITTRTLIPSANAITTMRLFNM